MPQEWKRLPLGRHGTCPPLFVRFIRSSKGYEISLTDLVYIWSESLNHKEILARASKIETSIDPSEDEDQFSVLLQKVEDALRGAKGCTISLSQSAKGHGLDLTTTTNLPSPLEPLDWTVHLSKLPQNALTRQILIPILKGEASRAARIQSLIDLLKEKDSAMNKIFDKVESSGLDLSRTFPGLSGARGGRKGSALSQVSKVVRGVAPFDEGSWNSSFAAVAGEPGEDTGMNFVTELDSVHSYQDWDAVQSDLLEEWWVRLESGVSSGDKPKVKAKKASPQPQRRADKEDATTSGSDDEFQRQETPPRLKRARSSTSANRETNRQAKSPENQTTDSDSESNEQTRPSEKQKPARKGLGTIGAKAKKRPVSKVDESTASGSESPEPPAKAKDNSKPKGLGRISKPKLTAQSTKPAAESTASENSDSGEPTKKKTAPPEDVETASDSDQDAKPPAPSKTKQPDPKDDEEEESDVDIRLPERKPPKSRIGGGLGQIGGKKRKDQKQQESKHTDVSPESEGNNERGNENARARAPAAAASSSPKPKRAGKLGTIGGRKSTRKATTTTTTTTTTTDSQPVKSHEEAGQETASGTDDDGDNTRRTSPLKKPKKEETSQDQMSRSRSPSARTRRSAWSKEPKEEEKKEEKEEEETAEERANRKREELRRQMETKGPAKKKRRF